MSTTIDDRVVEMRFDNSDFETNVSQTLSTLDKLKLALNLPGATKGLQDISTEAAKCDMAPLSKAVDTVSAKFSALDVIAFTALQNITNRVIDTGSRILREFTIEPISTGFSEYELKMDSVQTIMASTGESIDTVNKYLEELNKYSDRTIYSFSDMTNNIGKFTNAGVDLETAVNAIKGVSNAAALAGANSNNASHAMYNFAQALSTGFVQKIDWRSIEIANIATVQFKDELLKAAVACKTVEEAGDGMYRVLTTNNKGSSMEDAIDATTRFNDSLQYQWMTTEVLTTALAKYSDESTELGQKAYAAAQDVKTFSMMMDTLKEAAQSGWATTWETIIGDFEEAKEVWTDLNDIFSSVIGHFDDARNSFLKGGLSSSWKKLTDQITEAGVGMDSFETSLSEVVKAHGGNFTKIILDNKNLANAIQNGVIPSWQLAEAFHKIAEGAASAKDEESGLAIYTKEQIEQINKLDRAMTKGYNSAGKLLRTLTQESGRQYLFETLKNTLTGIIKLTSTFATAWRDIIPPVLTSDKLYNGLKFIGEFSRRLVLSDENADKLRRTLHGLFVPIDLVGKVIGKTGEMIFRVLSKAFGFTDKINFNILDYTAKLGDALTRFHDWVLDADRLGGYLGKVESKLSAGLEHVKGYVRAFWELPEVQKIVQKVQSKVGGFANNLEENLKGAAISFKNFSVNVFHSLKAYIDTLRNTPKVQDALFRLKDGLRGFIGNLPDLYWEGVQRIRDFIKAVKDMNGITLENVKTALRMFGESAYEYFSKIFGSLKSTKDSLLEFINLALSKLGIINEKFGDAGKGIKKYTEIVKDFVKEHKGALIAIAASAGMIFFIQKIAKALTALAKPLFDVGDFLSGVSGALNTVAKGINKKLKSEAIKNYAESIAILAGSLFLLSKIPTGDLIKAGVAITVLAGVLILLSIAMSKMDNSSLILNKNGMYAKHGGLLAVAASMILLVNALKQLDQIEHPENIAKNLAYMGVLALGLIAVVKILNGSKSEIHQAKATANAFMMLAIATSLKILVSSLDEIGHYDLKTIIKSLGLLLICALSMKAILSAMTWIDWKAGLSAVGAAMALIILVKAFKSIAELNVEKAKNNLEAFIMIFGLYSALMLASKLAGKNALRGGLGILAMASSLITLAIAIRMLAGMSASEIQKGVDAIKQIFAAFALVIAASFLSGKNAMRAGVMIGIMSGSMLLLSGAIFLLSEIGKNNPQGLERAIDAIKKLIEGYAVLIAASSFANQNKDAVKAITIMTVAIGMIAIAIAGLSMIPEERLNAAVKALGTLMTIFGLMTVLTRFSGGSVKSIGSLVIAIGIVSLALYLLKDIDPKSALTNATAISEVLLALAIAFKVVGSNSYVTSDFVKRMSAMLAALAVIALILGVMDKLDVQASIPTATALSILLMALAGACRIINNGYGINLETYKMLGYLVLILGGIALVMGIMAKYNVEPSIKTAIALSIMLEALAGACLLVAMAGRVACNPAAVTSAGDLLAMVGIVGGIMLAVAGLVSYIPGAQDFINNGIGILEQIAGGIGRIVRTFIDELLGVDSLSDIADDLSNFMIHLTPFLTISKTLDESVIAGIGTLVAAVAAVTTADAINGFRHLPLIRKLMGTGSLSEFGTELTEFAQPLVDFVNTIKAADIDTAEVESVANAAKCLAEFAAEVPNTGGKLADWIGDNKLGDFAAQLKDFAPDFVEFVNQTKDIKSSDTEGVAAAATAVAEFAKIVPNEGGWLADIVGDNTLDSFGAQLAAFATPFKTFISETKDIKSTDTEGVVAAATAVATFAEKVPNSGGKIADWIIGDNKLDDFGAQLEAFGPSFKTFIDSVTGIKSTAADDAVAAATVVSEFAKIVPNEGGLLQKIFGGASPLSDFGKDIEGFGIKFKSFNDNVKDVDFDKVTPTIDAVNDLLEIGQGDAPDSKIYTQIFTAIGNMGQNLKGFYSNIKDIEPDSINSFSTLIDTVASIGTNAESIDTTAFLNISEGLKQLGETDLSGFYEKMTAEIPNVSLAAEGLMTAFDETIANHSTKSSETFSIMLATMVQSISDKKTDMSNLGMELMNQFASGFTGNNMRLPRIMADCIRDIIAAIDSNSKEFYSSGEKCIDVFVEGFSKGQGKAATVMASVTSGIIDAIATNNGSMENAGSGFIKNFANGLMSGTSSTVSNFKGFVANLVSAANGYKPSMQTAGRVLMSNFVAGLKVNASEITKVISTKVNATLSVVRSYGFRFYNAGRNLAQNLKGGASAVSISGGFTSSITSALSTINGYEVSFWTAGSNLVRGFADGIDDYAYIAIRAARDLGKSTADALKASVKEKSPSKLTYEYGFNFDKGYANGISENADAAVRASERLGAKSVETLKNTLSTIGDMVDSGLDVEPTIRPVLDLSNVQAGLGQIDGMIDANRSMSLGYSGIITGRLSDTTNAISQQEQLSLLRRMSNLMDTYFPQFNEGDVYLDTGAIAGAVNRKLGLQT